MAAAALLLLSTLAAVTALLVGTAGALTVAVLAAVVLGWAVARLGHDELVDERRRHGEERVLQAEAYRSLYLERSAEHALFASRMRDRVLAAERLVDEQRGILRLAEARGDQAEGRARREARRARAAEARVSELQAELADRRPGADRRARRVGGRPRGRDRHRRRPALVGGAHHCPAHRGAAPPPRLRWGPASRLVGMSTWGRAARAARRRLRGARERLTHEPRLVGLVRPEPWTSEAHLAALRAALEQVSATSVLLVAPPGDHAEDPVATGDPTDLIVLLEPDALVDAEALSAAVARAREYECPVIGLGSRAGQLDPRSVIATASRWSATGHPPWQADATHVTALLVEAEGIAYAPSWWTTGSGDAHLPLAEQRRFRVDLAEARSEALLRAFHPDGPALPPVDVDELLGVQLYGWYADAVGGGPAYLEVLRPLVRDLVEGYEIRNLRVSARRAAYAAVHGSLEDLALLLDHDGDHPTGLPTTDDGLVELPDGLSDPVAAMPEEWRRVEEADRVSHVRLAHAWTDGDQVHLLGAAWIDYTPHPPLEVELGVAGEWRETDAEQWVDDQVALAVGRAHEDHPTAGFHVVAATGTALSFVRVRVGDREHVLEPTWSPDPPRGAPRVVAAEVTAGELRLGLDRRPDRTGTLVGPRARAHDGWVEGATLVLPLTATAFGVDGPLPAGRYRLDGLDVGVHPVLLADPPDLREGPLGVRLGVGPAGRLQVHVGTALTVHERSARGQQLLREAATGLPRRPRTVLLESFHGRSGGDNPGPVATALHALDPGLDLAFAVDDPRVPLPACARPVVRRSAEWHDLLQSSAAYVGNAAAPSWWTKPSHQVHLQTWHGTPLKRIGEDRGPGDLTVWRHRRDVEAQAAGWDALVSANPLSSRAFRTAFRYDGPLLESGYPRNDLLLDIAGRDEARAAVRSALGIEDHQRVVLYAPTWREHAGVKDAKPLFLDAPALVAAVPDAVVLVRGHYNATGSADAYAGQARVVDVTRYPDIAPLFCAADVLVTDYSSVVFDFALLDRPMVLLTPDLEHYRDVERGFYLDLEQRAPGDLVRTTDEVVERLRGEDTGAAARAAFREEFCPWDDGRAAERVARWVLDRMAERD